VDRRELIGEPIVGNNPDLQFDTTVVDPDVGGVVTVDVGQYCIA